MARAWTLVAAYRFYAYQSTEELGRLVVFRGKSMCIRMDSGPEFAGRMLDQWSHLHNVELDLSRPGKLDENPFMEVFNARLCSECLNASCFLSMADARVLIDAWWEDYDHHRLHTSLSKLDPD